MPDDLLHRYLETLGPSPVDNQIRLTDAVRILLTSGLGTEAYQLYDEDEVLGINEAADLRRAEIMTSEKSNSVKLSFAKNKLEITANSPEVGEAKESLAINYKGAEMAIAFNPKYLIDPLNALTNDEVFIELIDELSPGVLKINGPFLYVVMPMRLS
jgi:DNA polymerase-3 subunit beta